MGKKDAVVGREFQYVAASTDNLVGRCRRKNLIVSKCFVAGKRGGASVQYFILIAMA